MELSYSSFVEAFCRLVYFSMNDKDRKEPSGGFCKALSHHLVRVERLDPEVESNIDLKGE